MGLHLCQHFLRKLLFGHFHQHGHMQNESHKCSVTEDNKRENKVKFLISHITRFRQIFPKTLQDLDRIFRHVLCPVVALIAVLYYINMTFVVVKNEPYKTFM